VLGKARLAGAWRLSQAVIVCLLTLLSPCETRLLAEGPLARLEFHTTHSYDGGEWPHGVYPSGAFIGIPGLGIEVDPP
jgi:hypothetical protein